MPDLLRKVPFSADLLPYVQDFHCGNEEWERPLAAWIKSPSEVRNGALHELAKGKGKLQVWLHVNRSGEVVGYSSLGPSKWEWPAASDPKVPLSVIPYVAIDRRFWGQPKDDPPRYSTQILEHLIFEASHYHERLPLLGLFVHPQNTRAMKAYENAGFVPYFRKYLEDGVEYQSLVLKCGPVTPGSR